MEKENKNKAKQWKNSILILLLLSAGSSIVSCTKTNGCEYVEGDYYLTGTFHYFEKSLQIPKYPYTNILVNVNAYLVKDEMSGTYFDTMLITKSSVPQEYRKEGEKHVAVSIVNTVLGGTTTQARHDFYKLLCIEEIKEGR